MRLNVGSKLIWSWSDSGAYSIRYCATDDENDIITDMIVTYIKYEY